jgi:hypothetical protein
MRASDAKLAAALHEAGLVDMAKLAEQGHYNEFFGPLALPELMLAAELAQIGSKEALAVRACLIEGEFDAGAEESEEWARSPEGRDAFSQLAVQRKRGRER